MRSLLENPYKQGRHQVCTTTNTNIIVIYINNIRIIENTNMFNVRILYKLNQNIISNLIVYILLEYEYLFTINPHAP